MVVVLWVTGAETVDLSSLPWAPLCGAAALSLGTSSSKFFVFFFFFHIFSLGTSLSSFFLLFFFHLFLQVHHLPSIIIFFFLITVVNIPHNHVQQDLLYSSSTTSKSHNYYPSCQPISQLLNIDHLRELHHTRPRCCRSSLRR